jgi:hypothetical protein
VDFFFKLQVGVLMVSQYTRHLLNSSLEINDLVCEGLLAFTFELEHGAKIIHVLVDAIEFL